MKLQDLIKKAFQAGQKFGDYTSDENYKEFIDKHKEAINVIQCCTTLKDKETMTFKQWIKANGYYKKGFEWFNKHGYSRDFDKLKKYYELRDCL